MYNIYSKLRAQLGLAPLQVDEDGKLIDIYKMRIKNFKGDIYKSNIYITIGYDVHGSFTSLS